MSKFIKKSIAVLTAIILVMGVTGCMEDRGIDRNNMISYMENKYDDEFTYIDSFGGSFDGQAYQILVSSAKIPNAKISIGYYKTTEGEYFTDNYLEHKYADEVRDYLTQMLEDALGCDVIVTYGPSTTGTKNNFTSKTTLEEFVRSAEHKLWFNAVVSSKCNVNTDQESIEQRIKTALMDSAIICVTDIYFPNDEEHFVAFDALTLSSRKEMKKVSVSMDFDGTFTRFDWR